MSKTIIRHTLITKYFWHFCWLPYLFTFSLYKTASFIIVSEYISEYKLFKRSNKANQFIALVQYPVSQIVWHCLCSILLTLSLHHEGYSNNARISTVFAILIHCQQSISLTNMGSIWYTAITIMNLIYLSVIMQ
jgi:hypothetical protein